MGNTTQLKLLESNEAKKMLGGGGLAIDTTHHTQIKHIRRISDKWLEKVRLGLLTRFDAWTYFNSTVMKTLEYPLLALTLIEAEQNKIMVPVLSGGLLNI